MIDVILICCLLVTVIAPDEVRPEAAAESETAILTADDYYQILQEDLTKDTNRRVLGTGYFIKKKPRPDTCRLVAAVESENFCLYLEKEFFSKSDREIFPRDIKIANTPGLFVKYQGQLIRMPLLQKVSCYLPAGHEEINNNNFHVEAFKHFSDIIKEFKLNCNFVHI